MEACEWSILLTRRNKWQGIQGHAKFELAVKIVPVVSSDPQKPHYSTNGRSDKRDKLKSTTA